MMRIEYFGPGDFFEDAFLYGPESGVDNLTVVRATAVELVVRNPYSNFTTTFRGSGLPTAAQLEAGIFSGTITGWTSMQGSGGTAVTSLNVTGISWPLQGFIAALEQIQIDGVETLLLGLMNRQPITVDASQATVAVSDIWFEGVTQPVTFIASPFGDDIGGGDGNDIIDLGGVPAGQGDILFGSRGNDRILFSSVTPGSGWAELVYTDMHELPGGNTPITVQINGAANTGTISGGWGTDTLIDVQKIISDTTEGLSLVGSRNNDVFTIDGGSGSWLTIDGGMGSDTYNLTLSGSVRLGFRGLWTSTRPTQGVEVDLSINRILNDGYGNTEVLNVTAGPGRLELQGSDNADKLTGSALDNRFIVTAGNDTINGGAGWDMVRYDRAQLSGGVRINLEAGTAYGQWTTSGGATSYFVDRLTSIEEIRGSSHDDVMEARGLSTAVRFDGRSGHDVLTGGAGSDTLLGGYGDDNLDPGNNDGADVLDAGHGNDAIHFNYLNSGFFIVEHRDLVEEVSFSAMIDNRPGYGTQSLSYIDKLSAGRTILYNVGNALQAEGLQLRGSHNSDHFEAKLQEGDRLDILGGRGKDSYDISGDGATVRLEFYRDALGVGAETGMTIDVSRGLIGNDGFGNTETLTLSGDLRLMIIGTRHADVINGGAGMEAIFALGGNDTIDGGAGRDRLSYDRPGMTSGVQVDLGRGTSIGSSEGVAFSQRIYNIEDVHGSELADILIGNAEANQLAGLGGDDRLFGDGVKASAFLSEAAQVYRLYQSTLGREPDLAGHQYWTQQLALGLTTREALARSFMGSQEFLKTYGDLPTADLISLLYQNVLGRAAAPAEVNAWLKTGADAARIVLGLSDSPEFIAQSRAAATQYAVESDNANWMSSVYRLYQATLGREPDLAGLTGWSNSLARGTELSTAADGFVQSKEFQNIYGSLSDNAFVELLYKNVLGRAADAGGLTGWLSAMSEGLSRAEVVLGFSQSAEFITETAGDLAAWMRTEGADDLLIVAEEGNVMLHGGALSDTFQFTSTAKGNHKIHDFENWDFLSFQGFGYDDVGDLREHLQQSGTNVIFSDQDVVVTLLNTQLSTLSDATLLL